MCHPNSADTSRQERELALAFVPAQAPRMVQGKGGGRWEGVIRDRREKAGG